jgi:hypothetical protein
VRVIVCHSGWDRLDATLAALRQHVSAAPPRCQLVLDLFLWREEGHEDADETADAVRSALDRAAFDRELRRVVAVVAAPGGGRGMSALQHYTFRPSSAGAVEERMSRHLHPMMGKRLELWRLANFELERIPSVEDVYLFHGVARNNPKDERLFAFAEVRDLTPLREEDVASESLPHLEMQFLEALAAIRLFQSRRSSRRRLHWNRVILHVWPPLGLPPEQMRALAHRLLPAAEGLGLQKTVVRAQVRDEAAGGLRDTVIEISTPGGREVTVSYAPLADQPIASLSEYAQKVVRMRRRGLTHPYELVRMLAPPRGGPRTEFPPGEFEELDLDESGRLERVDRPPGRNTAHLVVGVIRNFTDKHPEGMARVILLGDPSGEMGSFAEPECRRIIAAIDLAERMGVPLEWLPVSAGAKIAMDSGTENLDWTAAALRRLVEFTQAGGEVNLVVLGINVGGQSYWNAEATMLMHDRGILVMTPDASMVLTGKKALDYSGGVSAEDHQGIGGYERIMGVNGEAQYWAADVGHACRILFRYYDHAYVAPGERFPRRAPTEDPAERDVRAFPYGAGEGQPFETVGDVFSDACNPGRRKPFEIRRIMHAVVDGDHEPLERWADMREAEGSVVWDAHLGGMPVCLVGIESTPIPRLGFVPADGPEQWTAGTLFPLSSKKVARAINAASGSRPVVVLANLSGFDGSPESLRRLQLRADRLLRDQPLSRRRLRGLLAHASREPPGGGSRGLVCLGDRGSAGGGGGLRRRGGSPHPRGRAAAGARGGDRGGGRGHAGSPAGALARGLRGGPLREARRGRRRVRPHSRRAPRPARRVVARDREPGAPASLSRRGPRARHAPHPRRRAGLHGSLRGSGGRRGSPEPPALCFARAGLYRRTCLKAALDFRPPPTKGRDARCTHARQSPCGNRERGRRREGAARNVEAPRPSRAYARHAPSRNLSTAPSRLRPGSADARQPRAGVDQSEGWAARRSSSGFRMSRWRPWWPRRPWSVRSLRLEFTV